MWWRAGGRARGAGRVAGSTRKSATHVCAPYSIHSLRLTHPSLPHLLKDGAVVLVAPDENLGDGPQRLDQQAPVSVRHRLVLVQHRVQVSGMKRETVLYIHPLRLYWDF